MDPELIAKAHAAIARGADPQAVAARFKELTGSPLPPPSDTQLMPQEDAQAAALRRTNARGGNAVTDFLAMARHGATFGFDDEIAGMVAGPKARDEIRQRVADRRLLNPGASALSEIAGGVAVPTFGGARVAGGVAKATGSRALGAVAGGMLSGAIGGGLYGAGEDTGGLASRAKAARMPGLLGALVGGVVGAGAAAVGRLGEKGINAAADTDAAQAVGDAARRVGLLSPESGQGVPAANASGVSAQAALRRALREAGVTDSDAMRARLQALGPDAVVADLGPNLGREARSAANQSSALSSPTGPIRGLERRAAGRGDRVADALRDASGIRRTFAESLEAAEQNVQAVRAQHYQPLEKAFPVVDGPNVAAALKDPNVAPVAEKMLGDGPPSFRALQDVMMELRDEMTAARAAGRPNRSQKASEAFETLIGAMEQDIPGFAEAQGAYRVAARRVSAHDLGRSMATGRKTPDAIMAELAALPDEAKEAFRLGMLDQIELNLRERAGGGGEALRLINADKTMLDRLRVVAENDEGMKKLLAGLDRESVYSRTWNALAGNSTTAQQVGDMMQQFVPDIPTNKEALVRQLLATLGGLSPAERRQAAEMLGAALMGKGEEAAKLLAAELAKGTAGGLGGAAGVAGGVGETRSLFK